MSHQLHTATIVPAAKGIGESDFAAARAALQSKYGVTVVEVFLDTVQTDGIITAGEFTIDLGKTNLRYLGFGADPVATPASAAPSDEPATSEGTTTTTTS